MVLTSLKMAHVVMKRKSPYTELECVVLLCLEMLLTLCTEEKRHRKRQIPLSDSTTKHRCDRISEDLLNQSLDKLKRAHSYGIQLNKTADISDDILLIVHFQFADEEATAIVEYYLCCLKIGASAAAQTIFDRLNQVFEEHGLDWTKCKSVSTNRAIAIKVPQMELFGKSKTSHLIVFRIIA